MNKPQTFTTKTGEEYVIIERREYEALLARPDPESEDDEDIALARYAARVRAEDAAAGGRRVLFPAEVVEKMATGNPMKVIREWRGLTQAQVAEKAGTDQSTVSALEYGRRRGSAKLIGAIARALEVPMDVLVVDDLPGNDAAAARVLRKRRPR